MNCWLISTRDGAEYASLASIARRITVI